MLLQAGEGLTFLGERSVDFGQALLVIEADHGFAVENGDLGFQCLNAAAAIIHLGGDGVLADGDARAGGVDEADGLVRQLARGNVTVRELDGGFDGFVEDLHLVMLLQRRLSANEEWSAALRGKRPGTEPWFSEASPALDSQQRLIDRWQTPLFFHALGNHLWEIRSAGPDRKLWTEDDLLEKTAG